MQYHPDRALLKQYIQGELPAGIALSIACHLEYCMECRELCAELEQEATEELLNIDTAADWLGADDGIQLPWEMSTAKQQAHSPKKQLVQTNGNTEVSINGHTFTLPRPLAKVSTQLGLWQKLVGSLWRMPLGHTGDHRVNLIYMENGGGIAEHTHKGIEITLVLAGSFEDAEGSYYPGDYILKDGSCTHKPFTNLNCLCLAVMDKPLHFPSGVARLLNPFSRLFF